MGRRHSVIQPWHAAAAFCVAAAASVPAAAQDGSGAAAERLPMVGGRGSYPQGSCAAQVWPREALRYEIEGNVQVRYRIAPDGHVTDAEIMKSSGWGLLDAASLQAARTCTFTREQAAQMQGRWMPTEFVWVLEGDRVQPSLVPGSCVPSAVIDGFQPYDKRPTDRTGVKVRFLVDAKGQPRAAKLEGNPEPGLAAEVLRHLDTCRFAFDPSVKGERTDTMSGRVLLR